ncbi:MAG: DUF4230 domain-containing protein [Anaerolineaceae bacterium]|nr:DUF4230 domain-containing protein [Anaerolineaceae bacterium]
MQTSKGWVLVVGILLILVGGVVAAVVTVRNAAYSAILPIQQGNSSLQTQMAGFLHPTPTIIPDPVTIIHEVRSLARLETIQFSVEKVITAETAQGRFAILFGDKLLFVAHGTVTAGVDLAKMSANDLSVQNGALNMRLPATEVFVATLDNANSYVYDRQTGVLTHGDMNLETTARRAAEDEIRKAALQDGILAEAQTNAQEYLSRLFRDMGFQDVIFTQATPEPPD